MEERLDLVPLTNGARIRIPQKPRMTLGIAASISTNGPIRLRTPVGASRLRKRAIATAIGTPSTSAAKEVTAVPKIIGAAPNSSRRVRLPGGAGEEAEAELVDRQARARLMTSTAIRTRGGGGQHRGEGADDEQRDVAEAVGAAPGSPGPGASRSALLGPLGGTDGGAHRRAA